MKRYIGFAVYSIVIVLIGACVTITMIQRGYLSIFLDMPDRIEKAIRARPNVTISIYNNYVENDTDFTVLKNLELLTNERKTIHYEFKMIDYDYKPDLSDNIIKEYKKRYPDDFIIISGPTRVSGGSDEARLFHKLIIFSTRHVDERYLNKICIN